MQAVKLHDTQGRGNKMPHAAVKWLQGGLTVLAQRYAHNTPFTLPYDQAVVFALGEDFHRNLTSVQNYILRQNSRPYFLRYDPATLGFEEPFTPISLDISILFPARKIPVNLSNLITTHQPFKEWVRSRATFASKISLIYDTFWGLGRASPNQIRQVLPQAVILGNSIPHTDFGVPHDWVDKFLNRGYTSPTTPLALPRKTKQALRLASSMIPTLSILDEAPEVEAGYDTVEFDISTRLNCKGFKDVVKDYKGEV